LYVRRAAACERPNRYRTAAMPDVFAASLPRGRGRPTGAQRLAQSESASQCNGEERLEWLFLECCQERACFVRRERSDLAGRYARRVDQVLGCQFRQADFPESGDAVPFGCSFVCRQGSRANPRSCDVSPGHISCETLGSRESTIACRRKQIAGSASCRRFAKRCVR
jgi:hypothetical protein